MGNPLKSIFIPTEEQQKILDDFSRFACEMADKHNVSRLEFHGIGEEDRVHVLVSVDPKPKCNG